MWWAVITCWLLCVQVNFFPDLIGNEFLWLIKLYEKKFLSKPNCMKSFLYSILKSDIFSHFISLKYLPRWVVLAFDIILCFIAYILSIYIATHLKIHSELILPVSVRFALLIFSQIFFFWLFHTYSGILRYSGFVDAAKLLFAVFSKTSPATASS